jgi:hypothetical protein
MNLALQVLVVGAVVVASLVYSTWCLLSLAARQRLLGVCARLPAVAGSGWFRALQARTRAPAGCGSCAANPGAASPKRTPGALPR